MLKHNIEKMNHDSTEKADISVSIGKIEENSQITVANTGWSEEEKDRMRQLGYDGLDIIREWYS
jgi:hypothetical protein